MRVLPSLLLGLSIAWQAACGGNPMAPTPEEEFTLPAGAPAAAAAPHGTTRITLTMVELVANGSSTPANALRAGRPFTARLWIFCPRGLEGTLDYGVIVPNVVAIYASGGAPLTPGYNTIQEDFGGLSAGSYTLMARLVRGFVTVATRDLTLDVSR